MKNLLKTLEPVGFVLIAVLAFFLGVGDVSVYGADVTPLADGGATVTGEPLTMENTAEASPELLMSDIDKRITRMKPMATPIDQISRHAKALKSEAMEVEYYSVDQKGIKTTMSSAYTEPVGGVGTYATDAAKRATIAVADQGMFDISDTIRVKGQKGYKADGTTASAEDLVLLVVSKSEGGDPIVVAVNGKSIASNGSGGVITQCVPTIASGKVLIRMGRSATELDVQTAQFAQVPTKESQYCQIYKMQVEQSTFNRMSKKEVDWDFSELEEDGVYDMRLTMENSILFSTKGKTYDPIKKGYAYTTKGLWWMPEKDIYYGAPAIAAVDETKGVYTLTIGTIPVANDMISVNGVEYIFAASAAAGKVTIGASTTTAAAALKTEIEKNTALAALFTITTSTNKVIFTQKVGGVGAIPVIAVTQTTEGTLAATIATTTAGVAPVAAVDANEQISENEIVDIFKEIFTGNSGNKKKLCFVGSDLMANLSKVDMDIIRDSKTVTQWGLELKEINTNFGKVYLFHHELLDLNDMSKEGFVMDPEYLTKKTFMPWDRFELDLQKAGIRNTDAVVLSEASCLYLRYPKAHARIHPAA